EGFPRGPVACGEAGREPGSVAGGLFALQRLVHGIRQIVERLGGSIARGIGSLVDGLLHGVAGFGGSLVVGGGISSGVVGCGVVGSGAIGAGVVGRGVIS